MIGEIADKISSPSARLAAEHWLGKPDPIPRVSQSPGLYLSMPVVLRVDGGLQRKACEG